MDVEQLLERLEGLEQNITIYKNDLKRLITGLDKEFDLDEDGIEDRITEIEESIEKLNKKKKKIIRVVKKELDNVG